VTWLQAVLEDGVTDRREILDAAHAAGHAPATVYRAAKRLGVVRRVTGFGKAKRSIWSLPATAQPSQAERVFSLSKNERTGEGEPSCPVE
jgi:hypothetical protein